MYNEKDIERAKAVARDFTSRSDPETRFTLVATLASARATSKGHELTSANLEWAERSLNLANYQAHASRTLTSEDRAENLKMLSIGLGGETGKVLELVKKHLYHGASLDRDRFREELGDVLWYLAGLAGCAGLDLGEVAEANIAKLLRRRPPKNARGGT